jgi:hypothetical protein
MYGTVWLTGTQVKAGTREGGAQEDGTSLGVLIPLRALSLICKAIVVHETIRARITAL